MGALTNCITLRKNDECLELRSELHAYNAKIEAFGRVIVEPFTPILCDTDESVKKTQIGDNPLILRVRKHEDQRCLVYDNDLSRPKIRPYMGLVY